MLLVVCAAMVVSAGFYVLLPLFRDARGNLEVELLAETELDRLLNRKAIVYNNLKELEFEYKMGRLSDSDFQRLEKGYKAEAGVILQKLDHLGVENDVDESIEKDIAARKAKLSSPRKGGDAAVCPACGAEVLTAKNFCADCGHRL